MAASGAIGAGIMAAILAGSFHYILDKKKSSSKSVLATSGIFAAATWAIIYPTYQAAPLPVTLGLSAAASYSVVSLFTQ